MSGAGLAALAGTMLLLSALPGPSDFAVVARTLEGGFRQGAAMVIGIIAADAVFIVIAALGLGAMAEHFANAFTLVRWLSGAYLVWLGVSAWRAAGQGTVDNSVEAATGYGASVSTGFLITFADPKAILFYVSLLPAFIDAHTFGPAQALVVLAIATAVIGTVKLAYAAAAERARRLFADARLRARLDRTAGAALVALGLFVIMATR